MSLDRKKRRTEAQIEIQRKKLASRVGEFESMMEEEEALREAGLFKPPEGDDLKQLIKKVSSDSYEFDF